MNSLYSAEFSLNSKLLALMYICWYFKYPLSIMLTMYEMYRDMSLYAFKAMSTYKKIKLTENLFIKILQESSLLYNHILKNKTILLKIKQLKQYNPNKEEIPTKPEINLDLFSEDYKRFITEFLLENVKNLYEESITLSLGSEDIYSEFGNYA